MKAGNFLSKDSYLGYHFAKFGAYTLATEWKRRRAMKNNDHFSERPPPAMHDGAPHKAPERRQRLIHQTIDHLRDHPVFEVPDPQSDGHAATALAPHDREREWELENLRLLKYRTILVTGFSMVSLPFFWLIFCYFAPHAGPRIALTHALMFGCCALLYRAARRVDKLSHLRLITLSAYIVYGLTSSAIMVIARDLNVITFSGHEQILLSLIFLPLTLIEATFCTFMVVSTYAVGISLALPDALAYTLPARVASLVFLGALIVVMIYLQGLLRRRAFDLSFDMALSAKRGAALSTLDEVTGGFNRRHLMNMLELELARSKRFEQPLGVIMFDLDNFKRVNDSNGHIAGDEVLRCVLRSASQTLREVDTIARYGGDEFVIVLPATDAHSAEQTAKRVRVKVLAALQNRFDANSLESQVTLSLGAIAVDSGHWLCVEEVIDAADTQLYKAKRAGKDQVYASVSQTAN